MEVDTGAVSIISEQTQKKFFPKALLQRTSIKLRTYTDEAMPVLGEMAVEVTYLENTHALTLYVVQGSGPNLLGRSWLQHIQLDWRSLGIATVQKVPSQSEALLKKYGAVFQEGLGTMHHFQASLHLNKDAIPRFHRPRPVPFLFYRLTSTPYQSQFKRGLHTTAEKVAAVKLAPTPKNQRELRSFLGLVNYYGKFVPNLASTNFSSL